MGEHQMAYVQLTHDVAYFLEHMEVLFLQEVKHRFESTTPGNTKDLYNHFACSWKRPLKELISWVPEEGL